MKIKSAEFVISNSDVSKCPKDQLPEFAFIGRSNVGKSSLINMLVEQKSLAKTSGKPGKTQLINHFKINNNWFLVDLPGYGYAKVSKTKKAEFQSFIKKYFSAREQLLYGFVLIDSRLEPQQIDLDFMEWLGINQIPFCIVFTKTDKISSVELQKNIAQYKRTLLKTWEEFPPYFETSAETNKGKEDVLNFIDEVIKMYPLAN
ncbi:MAG: ribosome biogenesis GTP-binding protein YihA/YsxC [Flavobacteriaceae bacterium]|nr:ribosome biogenesis GTP-binding protein YihA/YsxC [Flavobacteriaceae bacterium]